MGSISVFHQPERVKNTVLHMENLGLGHLYQWATSPVKGVGSRGLRVGTL
jgi:hypothetical protein